MTAFVFVAAFCLVAVLVYMARYSGRVRVEQVRLIDAPIDAVYAKVADFRHWEQWSPWLEHQPDARLRLSQRTDGQGSHCAWEGARVGAGDITHGRLVVPTRIDQRVRLKQPFSVRGSARWTFTDRAGKTEVRWVMRARVAFSMRAFAQTVSAALALDCRHGLDRLASLLEPADAPRYALSYLGVRQVEAGRLACRDYRGAISALRGAMPAHLAELRRQLAERGVQPLGTPMALYTQTNIKLRTTVCHLCWPIGQAVVDPFPVRELSAHRAYVVRLQGDLAALELAWYLAMQRMQLENLQPDQRLPPFERYLVDAGAAPDNQAVTELYLPVL